jgi:predicted tellurium resistance membrane protein TerC
MDNIFVIAIIFSAFKIPQKYQHQVYLGYSQGNHYSEA